MAASGASKVAAVLKKYEKELLSDWLGELKSAGAGADGRISESDLRTQAQEFLGTLGEASRSGAVGDIERPQWAPVREFLDGISKSPVKRRRRVSPAGDDLT